MIRSLVVGNVRLFEGRDWDFPLAPLTVFCGTNSAGKSTLVKIPMVLRDSLVGLSRDRGLAFTGTEVDLGSFSALVSRHDLDLVLQVGVEVPIELSAAEVAWWLAVTSGKAATPRNSRGSKDQDREVWRFRVTFEFAADRQGRAGAEPTLQSRLIRAIFNLYSTHDHPAEWFLQPSPDTPGSYQLDLDQNLFKAAFESYGDYTFPGFRRTDNRVCIDAEVSGITPDGVIAEAPLWAEPRRLPLPSALAGPLDALRKALAGSHYMGPLRTPAERYYVTRSAPAQGFDPTGAFLPYVLRDHLGREIDAHFPDGDPRPDAATGRAKRLASLFSNRHSGRP